MPHLVVGTAGHIDHGKSTLVRTLTGIDPDRLKEEKARGITIDLGFANWHVGDLNVAFVDVPGHERFVKNMLAGVGGIDAVLLVVAADEGVMPQTREHLDICRLLDVQQGIVAITKADLVEQEMLDLVQIDVAELVATTRLATAPVIAVSSATGRGMTALKDALASLVTRLGSRDKGGAARLPVDRVFSMRGFGTVATGTLTHGRLAPEMTLELLPSGRLVKVRGLQVHAERRDEAVAGERVAVNLAGVDVADVERGHVLASPDTLPVTRALDAVITALPSSPPLRHGARVRFHHGTAEILARVSTVGPATDGLAPVIEPGHVGVARLRLESPAALTRGDRFVLRAYSPSITIAGGRVLDPAPGRTGVRSPATRERLARLRAPFDTGAGEEDALALFVEDAHAHGVTQRELMARGGADTSVGRQVVGHLAARPGIWQVGDRLLLAAWRHTLTDRVTSALTSHHDSHPLSDGMPREEMRERVLGAAHPDVATNLLDALAAAGTIRGRERVALAGRGVTLTDEETAAQSAVATAYAEAGLTPPDTETLATRTGLAPAVIARVTQLLLRQHVLVRIDAFLFHREALAGLKAEVMALKASGAATIDVAAFKVRYGLSRKFAIPLLEYLDRERVTRRVGDRRVVL